MARRGKRLHFSGTALGLLACIVAGFLCGREEILLWLCFLPAVLVHETGHLLVARLCGVSVDGLKLDLLGARMSLGGMVSYGQEFFIALGGPIANFLSAAVTFGVFGEEALSGAGAAGVFFAASVALGGFNLLPVGTMDGGRMLTAVLAGLFHPHLAYGCVKVTTALFLICLWLFSTYALLMGEGMLSLFVFSLCLLVRLLSPDPYAEI